VDLGLGGRACVVTGASRGIGRATARLLAAEGARVLLVARSKEALLEAAAECRATGAEAEVLALDLTAPEAPDRIVARCEERFGPVEVLVANAGSNWVRPLEDLTDDDFDRHWQMNALALFRLLRAAVPGMAERGRGRVVNVSSMSGKRPSTLNLAYSATKAAGLAISRGFADTYGSRGVVINAVLPGPVDTPLWRGILDELATARDSAADDVAAGLRAGVPRGRFATEEEVAAIILFLCSEQAANVLGAAWAADGGSVQQLF
jgi:NAD(P)-dependent dehydrogenase (short-subunit alcohol dehydrogenase family)